MERRRPQASWARHAKAHRALKAGIEAMGLSFLVPEASRLPMLNAGLGALAGRIWRIGLMGQSAVPANVLLCLSAIEATLGETNAPITTGAAVPAAMRVLFQEA